jgi:alpha-galactosidase
MRSFGDLLVLRSIFLLALWAASCGLLPAAEGGLALTPPMGWNSWNHFACNVTDADIRSAADAMVSSGMRKAGYSYVNIDDCWQGKRDEKGEIHPNAKFPDIKALADYVHGKGLRLGIYSSPGPKTCAQFEGSLGHEEQDARTYASWGVDYLKYDYCSFQGDVPAQIAAYKKMHEALKSTGRPIVFSLCQYGMDRVWTWGPSIGGNLWRTTDDISDNYDRMAYIGFGQNGLERFAGPGHWNDPDMLEVGNGKMNDNEYRTHMALWCLLAAPLLAGNDPSKMTPETLAILTNPEVIAVDQDPLGIQGRRVAQEGQLEVWAKPLADGSKALGLVNRGESTMPVTAYFRDAGEPDSASVRDLWGRRDLGVSTTSFTAQVLAHGVVMIKIW